MCITVQLHQIDNEEHVCLLNSRRFRIHGTIILKYLQIRSWGTFLFMSLVLNTIQEHLGNLTCHEHLYLFGKHHFYTNAIADINVVLIFFMISQETLCFSEHLNIKNLLQIHRRKIFSELLNIENLLQIYQILWTYIYTYYEHFHIFYIH